VTDHQPTPGDGHSTDDGVDRRRAWLIGIGLGILAIAALAVAFTIGTNYSDDPPPATEASAPPAAPADNTGPGRDLFIQRCGGCHALGDAGTTATVGPDLGKLRPAKAVVEQAIEKGGTGSGKMPPGLAKGEELTQIADYVAAAAGG